MAQTVKNLPAMSEMGSIPELGRSPGGRHGNSLQYSCLENHHGQRSVAGTVHEVTQLSNYAHIPSLLIFPAPSHPTSRGHHRALGWASCVCYAAASSLDIYFTQESVHMLMILSWFLLASLSPTGFTSLFSMTASPFLPSK